MKIRDFKHYVKVRELYYHFRQRAFSFRKMKAFYAQFMSPNDLVFDIGANVGMRSAIFSSLARKVVAVEPQAGLVSDKLRRTTNVVVVEKACGACEGCGTMLIASSSTISSLANDWVEAVQKSHRFDGEVWKEKRTVEVTTLDALIRKHGVPGFIKIDVEGYEDAVLRGLSTPVNALSFEFVAEHEISRQRSLEKICALGDYEFNYDLGERFNLYLNTWVGVDVLCCELNRFRSDCLKGHGDVYARLRSR